MLCPAQGYPVPSYRLLQGYLIGDVSNRGGYCRTGRGEGSAGVDCPENRRVLLEPQGDDPRDGLPRAGVPRAHIQVLGPFSRWFCCRTVGVESA